MLENWFFYILIFFYEKVVQGIELAAYENLPGNQPIDLQGILGDLIPQEVVQNLQPAVNDIGRT